MSIKKAVFPVAGLGTRFLPATKASPKEMLPIVDKPLIQYAVEEAVAAGIDTLIFVTGRSKNSIMDHFDKAYELENELEMAGKKQLLEIVQSIIPPHVNCVYIRQAEALGLGHAVLCAEHVVGSDPFAVLLADDLLHCDGAGCLSRMIDVHSKMHGSVLGVTNVPEAQVSSYGIIAGEKTGERLTKVSSMVEKPAVEEAPSTLAVIGRYILSPSIFHHLSLTERGRGGEIQLTDAIAAMLKTESVYGMEIGGKRYDCGSKLGYLEATVEMAMMHPEVAESFKAYLKQLSFE
ncbi:MAG: UTP--glucose-1-phosphate uridylyltransferase GalU [Methylococcales bacterium]|jgi:UTP--glucose-1-phosphate uridylyltransferase|nr:UTP--glucose-1-phosphate uridylyltransferase GalU [Methylococcales bacterium]MBT7445999.1 UTP--glucose-1-phosphate uridylyltransferase GalU [Methylococcales bacterium]